MELKLQQNPFGLGYDSIVSCLTKALSTSRKLFKLLYLLKSCVVCMKTK